MSFSLMSKRYQLLQIFGTELKHPYKIHFINSVTNMSSFSIFSIKSVSFNAKHTKKSNSFLYNHIINRYTFPNNLHPFFLNHLKSDIFSHFHITDMSNCEHACDNTLMLTKIAISSMS